MPIPAQCPGCQSRFNLQDQLAGQHVQCQNCETVFTAPRVTALPDQSLKNDFVDHTGSTSGLQAVDSKQKKPGAKHKTTYTKVKSQKSFDGGPLVVGGIVTFAVLLLVGIGLLVWALVGAGDDADVAGGSGGGTDTQNDTEQSARNDQELARNGPTTLKNLTQDFKDKVVTVQFTNVKGDTKRAKRYLKSKILDAAYYDYRQDERRAEQQTDANRKAAEQKAIASASPYQRLVHYEYQPVQSTLPFPVIREGGRMGSTITYYCGPCIDPSTFSRNVGMPNSKVNGRVITIKCDLPKEIPHPAVEKLILQHGQAAVAKVVVNNVEGAQNLVELFFREKTPKKLGDGSPRIVVVGIEKTKSEVYQFYIGPIDDIDQYAAVLETEEDWAKITKVDSGQRVISVKASMPEVLPTYADFQALREMRWKIERKEQELLREEAKLKRDKENEARAIARNEQRAKDEAERAAQRAIDTADRNGTPRPGEPNADWIQRNFADKSSFKFDDFLTELAKTEVEAEILPMVSENLVNALVESESSRNFDEIVDAMFVWRTDDTDAAIIAAVDDSTFSSKVETLMGAMKKIGTDEAAEQLVVGLTHRSLADTAKRHLIDMGSMVEPMVTPYMKHQDIQVRYRAYEIIYHVGTRASLPMLKENRGMEKNVEMKKNIKSAMDAINERHPEEEAEGE